MSEMDSSTAAQLHEEFLHKELARLKRIERDYNHLITLLDVISVHEPFENKTVIQISVSDMVASGTFREAVEKFFEWKKNQLLSGDQNV